MTMTTTQRARGTTPARGTTEARDGRLADDETFSLSSVLLKSKTHHQCSSHPRLINAPHIQDSSSMFLKSKTHHHYSLNSILLETIFLKINIPDSIFLGIDIPQNRYSRINIPLVTLNTPTNRQKTYDGASARPSASTVLTGSLSFPSGSPVLLESLASSDPRDITSAGHARLSRWSAPSRLSCSSLRIQILPREQPCRRRHWILCLSGVLGMAVEKGWTGWCFWTAGTCVICRGVMVLDGLRLTLIWSEKGSCFSHLCPSKTHLTYSCSLSGVTAPTVRGPSNHTPQSS
ncbi:hypothetical protein BJ875DRAFT_55454 [Amylocarpus encephaloides]|uniref:Uncharacterized protein n=1 Tax=Amylocarpus encephaloides TaxID=45428 RepID=A0A9P8C4F9_9HELO|nr:hypothetical protein BJ875DRAFT_55454 [Amylocarpus encephaloides]